MNWMELLAATVSASLIGSIHCVGMCGPFAIMATQRRSDVAELTYRKIAGYHLGRLTTYLILGTLAGLAGTLVNSAGHTLGWSHSAARIVGAAMILLGLGRLVSLIAWRSQAVSHSVWLQRWTRGILAVGKRLQPVSPIQRAYVIGLITTWLPCGWLYLFALAASSAGSVLAANALMFAFWLGTLPLLSILSIGSASLRQQLTPQANASPAFRFLFSKTSLQGLAAGLMIGFGLYTFLYRSQVDLESLASKQRSGILTRTSLQALGDQPLPCCSHAADRPGVDVEASDAP